MKKELPNNIEGDDQRFFELMDLQDPDGIAGIEEEEPTTIEDKYERQITMEKVIQPMLDKIFENQEDSAQKMLDEIFEKQEGSAGDEAR